MIPNIFNCYLQTISRFNIISKYCLSMEIYDHLIKEKSVIDKKKEIDTVNYNYIVWKENNTLYPFPPLKTWRTIKTKLANR